MTVRELRRLLAAKPPNAHVVFCQNPAASMALFSIVAAIETELDVRIDADATPTQTKAVILVGG